MSKMIPFVVCLFVSVSLFADDRVSVIDFGAKPNSKENAVEAVHAAVESCRNKDSATLVFPKGRYDFFPIPEKHRSDALSLHGIKNLTIDGEGSEFVLHGVMGVVSIGNGENLTFKNFSVDWEKPLIVQGEVVAVTEESVDLRFDREKYPFDIENERLVFHGEGWKGVPQRDNLFDPKTKEMLYRTRDCAMGWELYKGRTETIAEDTVRIHSKPKFKPPVGTLLGLWLDVSFGKYGFNIQSSKNIAIRNVDLFHALGLGVIAQRTENLTLDNVNCKANDAKGRVFSTAADAFHLNNMKGLVKVENCECSGMGDDFLNLHGKNMMIRQRIDDRTVEVSREQREAPMYSFKAGDEIWFLDAQTMQRKETATIETIETVKEDGKIVTHRIRFKENIPNGIGDRSVMENKTFNAELEVRNCRINKRNRARGILVTTPLRTVIENNYFRSAGAAILVEGDTSFWFESGACGDLLIRDNVFEDCFTSGPEWGEAVITVTPSFKPTSETDAAFHRNIRIENNEFKHFDPAILFARSVDGLVFRDNTIQRSRNYRPFMDRTMFFFDGCRGVLLEGNRYDTGVLGMDLRTEHMNLSNDIRIKDSEIRLHDDRASE